MAKVIIAGCGQLGSRHMQAAASLDAVDSIVVFDCHPESLQLGRQRLEELDAADYSCQVEFVDTLEGMGSADLCIVATQARGRCQLVETISSKLGVKRFLIEKVVSPTVREYEKLMTFCEENNVTVWVNCKTRAYEVHKYIKSILSPEEPLTLTRTCGNHGLGNNGIHIADLFCYYTGGQMIECVGTRIDPQLHSSKRGQDIFDLSGSLFGTTNRGDELFISMAAGHISPDTISVVAPQGRFMIDHHQKTFMESLPEDNWAWHIKAIDENYMVSHMTKTFVSSILSNGQCDLPTLQACFPAHKFILESLLVSFNQLLQKTDLFCPIT